MNKIKFLATILLLAVTLNTPLRIMSPAIAETSTGKAHSAAIQAINGKNYYPAVKKAIEESKKSIYVVMYHVSLSTYNKNSKIYKLVNELIEAHNRGVLVKVILDQNIDFVGSRYVDERKSQGKNAWCFKMLKEAGIDVQYDTLQRYTHAKAVVVDGETVILGSSNWSASAFDKNAETNVLIKSKSLADNILAYFDKIKIDTTADISDSKYTPISWKFLENPKLAGHMLTESDKRVFDVYLLLLKEFGGNPDTEIIFDYDKIAGHLGMSERMDRTAYRRQLIKTLRKLENQYKLIKFNPKFAENAAITLLSYDDPEKPYAYPEEWFFQVPDIFWRYRWDQKLSFPAKYCYFINLAYVSISNAAPWWYSNRDVLSKRFNITKGSISTGMGELRRLNLIDVSYGTPENGDYSHRLAKSYKLLPLYDPKWLESEWDRLKQAYGEEQLDKARKYAEIVFKESDSQDVEEIILMMNSQGEEIVKKAFAIVAKKNIDNPKRCYAYVKGIVKKMAE